MEEEYYASIKFKVDDKDLEKTESALKKTDEKVNQTEKDVNRLGDSTKSAFEKFAIASTAAFTSINLLSGAFRTLGSVIGSLKNFELGNMAAYEVQLRSELTLSQTLKNQIALGANFDNSTMDRMKKLASEMQGKTMYGDEAYLGGIGELSTYFSDENALKKMVPLLADYAAGMSTGGEVGYQQMIDLATGLGKAVDGNYEALNMKGFDTSGLKALTEIQNAVQGMQNAKTEKEFQKYKENLQVLSKDYEDAVKKIVEANGEIDESLKVEMLGKALETWNGLSEAYAKTPIGKLTQLKNTIGDIRETLGEDMYDALIPVFDKIKDGMPKIEKIMKSIGDTAVNGVSYILENADTIMDAIESIGDALELVSKNLDLIIDALKLLALVSTAKLVFGLSTSFKGLATNLGLCNTQTRLAVHSMDRYIHKMGLVNGVIAKTNNELRKGIGLGGKFSSVLGGVANGLLASDEDLNSSGGVLKTFGGAVATGAATGGPLGAVIAGGASVITMFGRTLYEGSNTLKENSNRNKERIANDENYDKLSAMYSKYKDTTNRSKKQQAEDREAFKAEILERQKKGWGVSANWLEFAGLNEPVQNPQKTAEKTALSESNITNINSNNTISQNNTIGAEMSELGKLLRTNLVDILERNLKFDAISTEVVGAF